MGFYISVHELLKFMDVEQGCPVGMLLEILLTTCCTIISRMPVRHNAFSSAWLALSEKSVGKSIDLNFMDLAFHVYVAEVAQTSIDSSKET